MSLYKFFSKDAEAVEEVSQGERSAMVERGVVRGVIGGTIGLRLGCGCRMWEMRERLSWAPAESPATITGGGNC